MQIRIQVMTNTHAIASKNLGSINICNKAGRWPCITFQKKCVHGLNVPCRTVSTFPPFKTQIFGLFPEKSYTDTRNWLRSIEQERDWIAMIFIMHQAPQNSIWSVATRALNLGRTENETRPSASSLNTVTTLLWDIHTFAAEHVPSYMQAGPERVPHRQKDTTDGNFVGALAWLARSQTRRHFMQNNELAKNV